MIQHVVDFLNEALKQDRDTVGKMFLDIAIPASESMINHPTIQINHENNLRLIGLLNGLVRTKDNECIVMTMDEHGKGILRFDVKDIWWHSRV